MKPLLIITIWTINAVLLLSLRGHVHHLSTISLLTVTLSAVVTNEILHRKI